MKKPNITPGDWHPDTGKFSYGDFPVVMAPDHRMVCAMHDPFEAGKANAQAIAALPRLLEALEWSAHALEGIAMSKETNVLPKLTGQDNFHARKDIAGIRSIADQAREALYAAGYTYDNANE